MPSYRLDPNKRRKVERFQERELQRLAKLNARELLKLPKSQELAPPDSLAGERFLVRRQRIAKGTYQISVAHEIRDDPAVIASIERDYSAFGFGEVKIGPGNSSRSFFLLPDGTIQWPDDSFDPED